MVRATRDPFTAKHIVILKLLPTLLIPCLLSAFLPQAAAQSGEGQATYRVTFNATWSPSSHPGAFPGGAHFSPLTGATHSSATTLWSPGGMASNGIESMAETGSVSTLQSEVNGLILAGTAGEIIHGPGAGATDSVSTTFTVSADFPLASIVTMIAPSPDWFVGVHDVALLENDAWVDQKVMPLFAYDSGTDNGSQFTSSNQNSVPQQPLHLITTGPLAGAAQFGTFTFERLHSSLEIGVCNNPAGSLALSGSPQIGQNLSFQFHNPLGTTSTPAATALGISFLPLPGLPCGVTVPGLGLAGPGNPGDLVISNLDLLFFGPMWNGSPVSTTFPIPMDPSLVGLEFYAQGALIDAAAVLGATSALHVVVGA